VLKKENVTDAVIVVTRYFGGILLGAGGLVRAYSHAAKLALDAGGRLEMRPCTVFSLDIPYPLYDRLSKLIKDRGLTVIESDFGAAVRLTLRIQSDELASFTFELTEHSGGALTPAILREEFA
jgi:putative IMPACT (imprinted ancient) family translation regulator